MREPTLPLAVAGPWSILHKIDLKSWIAAPSFRTSVLGLPDSEQLPSFSCIFADERNSRHCVLIPVINEGERIIRQLLGMKSAELHLDISNR